METVDPKLLFLMTHALYSTKCTLYQCPPNAIDQYSIQHKMDNLHSSNSVIQSLLALNLYCIAAGPKLPFLRTQWRRDRGGALGARAPPLYICLGLGYCSSSLHLT